MKSKEYSEETKGQVIGMRKCGLKEAEIGAELDIPRTSVHDVIARFEDRGTTKNLSRSGRPSPITPRITRQVLSDISNNPSLPWPAYGNTAGISGKQVKSIANNAGLFKRIKRKKPFIPETGRIKRLAWAVDNATQAWDHVLFTDESSIEMGKTTGSRWTIRAIGEAYEPQHLEPNLRSQRKTIMVWGAIALGKKYALHRVIMTSPRVEEGKVMTKGGLDSEGYVRQIINGTLGPILEDMRESGRANVIVVEDGAPSHRANKTQSARDDIGLINLKHPPYSPDLNPIENVWFMVKQRVSKMRPRPTNSEMLWEYILVAWEAVPQKSIDKAILSMPARRLSVIKHNGLATEY